MANDSLDKTESSSLAQRDRSVMRAGQILGIFVDTSKAELGISEISSLTGLSPSTVHRIVRSLVEINMLTQNVHNGRYSLGDLVLSLGRHAFKLHGLDVKAFPAMHTLANRTGEAVNLGVLVQNRVVYVQKIYGIHPLRTDFPIGIDVPVHCSAIGKAIMAFSTPDVVNRCLEHDFAAQTSATITARPAMLTELEQIRQTGYSIDREEFMEGITCIGAPVFSDKRVIAAIAIQAPTIRMGLSPIEIYAPMLLVAAREITQSMS